MLIFYTLQDSHCNVNQHHGNQGQDQEQRLGVVCILDGHDITEDEDHDQYDHAQNESWLEREFVSDGSVEEQERDIRDHGCDREVGVPFQLEGREGNVVVVRGGVGTDVGVASGRKDLGRDIAKLVFPILVDWKK